MSEHLWLGWARGRALRLEQARGPCAAAKTGLGGRALRLGQARGPSAAAMAVKNVRI